MEGRVKRNLEVGLRVGLGKDEIVNLCTIDRIDMNRIEKTIQEIMAKVVGFIIQER